MTELQWKIMPKVDEAELDVLASGPVDDALLKLLRTELFANTPMRAWKAVEVLHRSGQVDSDGRACGTVVPDSVLVQRILLTPIQDQDPYSKVQETIEVDSDSSRSRQLLCTALGALGSGLEVPIPLHVLNEGEVLKLRATCGWGVGSDHSRFVPVVGDIQRRESSPGRQYLHIEFVIESRKTHIEWWTAALARARVAYAAGRN